MQAAVSSLRYILEALAKTERFLQDKEYLKIFYYQYLFDHRDSLIKYESQILKDIELLDQYSKKTPINEDEEDKMYDLLDDEFSIGLNRVSMDTIYYTRYRLLNEVIPSLKDQLVDINNKILNISINYGITEESKKNHRKSIAAEFKELGLNREYDFVYDYTSNLIHCRSYSIYSPSKLDNNEIIMFRSLSTKFVNRIAKNLINLSQLPEYAITIDLGSSDFTKDSNYKTTATDHMIEEWHKKNGWSVYLITETLKMNIDSNKTELIIFKHRTEKIDYRYITPKEYDDYTFNLKDMDGDSVLTFDTIEDVVSAGWVLDI